MEAGRPKMTARWPPDSLKMLPGPGHGGSGRGAGVWAAVLHVRCAGLDFAGNMFWICLATYGIRWEALAKTHPASGPGPIYPNVFGIA